MYAEEIATALAVIRNSEASSDLELHFQLVATGMDRRLAARLVEYLPMACCRILLLNSGVHFSATFQRLEGGLPSPERALNSEPIWREVWSFVTSTDLIRTRDDLFLIATRSAEFDAVNQLLKNGAALKDVRLTSTIFAWNDDGPSV